VWELNGVLFGKESETRLNNTNHLHSPNAVNHDVDEFSSLAQGKSFDNQPLMSVKLLKLKCWMAIKSVPIPNGGDQLGASGGTPG
jgi:hypothetical protein